MRQVVKGNNTYIEDNGHYYPIDWAGSKPKSQIQPMLPNPSNPSGSLSEVKDIDRIIKYKCKVCGKKVEIAWVMKPKGLLCPDCAKKQHIAKIKKGFKPGTVVTKKVKFGVPQFFEVDKILPDGRILAGGTYFSSHEIKGATKKEIKGMIKREQEVLKKMPEKPVRAKQKANDRIKRLQSYLKGGIDTMSIDEANKSIKVGLAALEKKWEKKGVRLELHEDTRRDPTDIELIAVVIEKGGRKGGIGTQVMEDLTVFADKHGRRIVLTTDIAYGGTSIGRLKKFYRKFGFVENKGRNADYRISANMYRKAKTNESLNEVRGHRKIWKKGDDEITGITLVKSGVVWSKKTGKYIKTTHLTAYGVRANPDSPFVQATPQLNWKKSSDGMVRASTANPDKRKKLIPKLKRLLQKHGYTPIEESIDTVSIDEVERKTVKPLKNIPGLTFERSQTGANVYLRIYHEPSGSIIWRSNYPVKRATDFKLLAEKLFKAMKWDMPADKLDMKKGRELVKKFTSYLEGGQTLHGGSDKRVKKNAPIRRKNEGVDIMSMKDNYLNEAKGKKQKINVRWVHSQDYKGKPRKVKVDAEVFGNLAVIKELNIYGGWDSGKGEADPFDKKYRSGWAIIHRPSGWTVAGGLPKLKYARRAVEIFLTFDDWGFKTTPSAELSAKMRPIKGKLSHCEYHFLEEANSDDRTPEEIVTTKDKIPFTRQKEVTTKGTEKGEKYNFTLDDVQKFYDLKIAGGENAIAAVGLCMLQFGLKNLKISPMGDIQPLPGLEKKEPEPLPTEPEEPPPSKGEPEGDTEPQPKEEPPEGDKEEPEGDTTDNEPRKKKNPSQKKNAEE